MEKIITVKMLREKNKLNLATVAKRTGIPRETLEQWESGAKIQFTFTQICALAYVYKVPVKNICSVDVDSIWVDEPEEANLEAKQPETKVLSEEEQRKQIGQMVAKRAKEQGITAKQITTAGINNGFFVLFTQGNAKAQEIYKTRVAKLLDIPISELEVKK